MIEDIQRYYGLYRAIVVNNDDSKEEFPHLGRVQIRIPEVLGDTKDTDLLPWAWPCMSLFGGPFVEENGEKIQHGVIAIPSVGATLWVMFERGDPRSPVYMGSWYNNEIQFPREAISSDTVDGHEADYPRIMIIKPPWGKNVFIRFSDERSLEFVFGDDIIKMKAPTEEDGDDGLVSIKTKKSSISFWIEDEESGKISLRAPEIEIWAKKKLDIFAGEWEKDDEGRTHVTTTASMQVMASEDLTVYTERTGQIGAHKDKGSWSMRSPETSGFEKHP